MHELILYDHPIIVTVTHQGVSLRCEVISIEEVEDAEGNPTTQARMRVIPDDPEYVED